MFPLIIYFICVLFSFIFILLAVAFYTLMERKFLGYSHERFGPNKVGLFGLLQPFSDALKLFSKENILSMKSVMLGFYTIVPMWGLLISILLWCIFPFWSGFSVYNIGWLLFFCISSFSIYFMLLSGWSGMSKYGVIGSYRSSSQAISYEVVMILCVLSFCLFSLSYDLIKSESALAPLFFLMLPLFILWVLSCFAETNRSPFDFSEGESELVSGFNTEYMGGLFSLIFIGEYSSILFLSSLTSICFFRVSFFYLLGVILVSLMFLWVRTSFPRLRYDKLMMVAWKGLLIFVLSIMSIMYFLVN